jgi:phenylpropionate dioxygenase-like ring-hydroxylating dioxygenase large terminal subunit
MKIPEGWYVILSSRELGSEEPVSIERFGLSLVAWRDSTGSPVVMADTCPHRSVKLSLGKLSKDCIVCPFHGFEFDRNGVCQLVPETKKPATNLRARTFPAAEKYCFLWIYLGEKEELKDIPWFTQLQNPKLIYSEESDVWPIHVSRCVENQLDYAHLPYLHRTTIGKGFDVSVKRNFELENDEIALKFESGGSFQFKFGNILDAGN